MTRDLYSLNLLVKLTLLHHQILFSLAIAAIAEACPKPTERTDGSTGTCVYIILLDLWKDLTKQEIF